MSPLRCSPVSNYEAEVRQWAEKLLGAPVRLTPLSGGANNHLFRCRGPEGVFVIKRYREQNFGAQVSRRQAEVAFLRHASIAAPDFVPQLIAVHEHRDMIAMALVDGDSYEAGKSIPESDVEAALDFYRNINSDREAVTRHPVAAREGYRSISEHIRHVEKRISALSVTHLPAELRQAGQSSIDEVSRRFDAAQRALMHSLAVGEVVDELAVEHLQLSPGDFGFHNAIRVVGKPVFIDFEYAGADDAAKTLADFFLQPRCPVDRALFDRVASRLSVAMPFDHLVSRSRALGRLLSVKWLTIVLSPMDAARFPSFSARYGAEAGVELSRRLQRADRFCLFE